MTEERREKLKVVFRLAVERDSAQLQTPSGNLVKVSPVSGDLDGSRVFQVVLAAMEHMGMPLEFALRGAAISRQDLQEKIGAGKSWPSGITSNGVSLQFALATSHRQSFLMVEELVAGAAKSWEEWVSPFLAEAEFVQAWVSDVDYDRWQNAQDLKEFESAGRTYAHLPMKSNGLPPPLKQDVIDTSSNPGRWSLKPGYVEAVGATMWLGANFWKLVGEERRADVLAAADWLGVRALPNGALRLDAAERAFFDQASGQVQRQLRSIVYGHP